MSRKYEQINYLLTCDVMNQYVYDDLREKESMMADEIWRIDVEEKLIEYWQELPSLYDVSSPSYSNRLHKRKAQEDVPPH
jgi:hypothetical protein